MIIEPISGGLYLITVPDLTRKKGKRLLDDKKIFFKQINLKKKIKKRSPDLFLKKSFSHQMREMFQLVESVSYFFDKNFNFFSLQIQISCIFF